MRKSSLLVAVLALTLVVPIPGSAAAGCSIIATGLQGGTCTYTAAGPGEYKVAGVSGYRIEILSPLSRKGTLVARNATPENPASGLVAAAGDLATEAGDVLSVAITIGQYTLPNEQVLRYQDGYATAGDKA